jgi:glycosyltransferase involved in cell wall biosynthesis
MRGAAETLHRIKFFFRNRISAYGEVAFCMNRILQVTTVHHHTDVRILKHIDSLRQEGFEVHFAVPVKKDETPTNAFPVVHLPCFSSRMLRALLLPAYVFFKAFRFDVIHFHDPELLGVGTLLRLLRKKVIYDVHEDYRAQIRDKEWIPRPLRLFAGIAVRFQERLFHALGGHIVAATPHIASLFPEKRRCTVRNVPELSHWPEPQAWPDRTIAVSFVGEVRPVRGAFVLQQTAEKLFAQTGKRITVAGRLAGMSEAEKTQFVQAPGIDYRGKVSYSEAVNIMRRSVLGFVPFQAAENNVTGLPTKILEYFAAGTPVVMSDFPVWRKAYSTAEAAFFIDPADSDAAVKALEFHLADSGLEKLSKNVRAFVENGNVWETEKHVLTECYRNVLRR